eukprot:9492493-Pyramimonas_sp.AAC.1
MATPTMRSAFPCTSARLSKARQHTQHKPLTGCAHRHVCAPKQCRGGSSASVRLHRVVMRSAATFAATAAAGSESMASPKAEEMKRRQDLEKMTVDKGLKPLLRAYGLPLGGKKSILVERIIKHELGYPDADEDIPENVKQNAKQAMTVMKGYRAWRNSRTTTAWSKELPGAAFDVAGLFEALSALALEDNPGEDSSAKLKDGLFNMQDDLFIRMQLEALTRSIEALYIRGADTLYQSHAPENRGVRVDIDIESARILVAVQTLSADGQSVVKETDDTERALVALRTAAPLETKVKDGGIRGTRQANPIAVMKELYLKQLQRLRAEFDANEEERLVEEHFGGSSRTVVMATVVRGNNAGANE